MITTLLFLVAPLYLILIIRYFGKRFTNGLMIIVILEIITTAFQLRIQPIFQIFSISVYIYDIITILLIITSFYRINVLLNTHKDILKYIFLFTVFMIFSMITSYLNYGQSSMVSMRKFFYFTSLILYALVFDINESEIRKIFKIYLYFALAIILIFYLRIFGFLQMPLQARESVIVYEKIRYLIAEHVLQLIIFSTMFLYQLRYKIKINNFFYNFLLINIFVIVFINPQRTIWIIALFLIYIYLKQQHLHKVIPLLFLFSIVGLFLIPIVFELIQSNRNFIEALSNAVTKPIQNFNYSTGGLRIASWVELVKMQINDSLVLLGRGFGSDLTRYVKGIRMEYGAHNVLVSYFVNGGLIGAIFLSFILLKPIKYFWLDSKKTYWTEILKLWLLFEFIFSMTAVHGFFMALPFAIALSQISNNKKNIKKSFPPFTMLNKNSNRIIGFNQYGEKFG